MRYWLTPRMVSFRQVSPGCDIRVNLCESSDIPLDAELAVRFGDGDWPGVRCHLLFAMLFVPVCSPQYLQREGVIRSVRDLSRHVILQDLERPNDWHTWFSSTGESYGIVKRHLSITGADIAFHAA
jgi:LysR family glycine cleavage system transcriptional activator